jgi:hypothetical protein
LESSQTLLTVLKREAVNVQARVQLHAAQSECTCCTMVACVLMFFADAFFHVRRRRGRQAAKHLAAAHTSWWSQKRSVPGSGVLY